MNSFQFLAIAAFASFVLSAPAGSVTAPGTASLGEALDNLRASDADWKREDAAYRAQRKAGTLSGDEAGEYAEFVTSLHRRKLEDCETVRGLGGNKALEDFDCVILGGAPDGPLVKVPPKAEAKMESEKVEDLEREMKRLEAELDEELMRKQDAYRREAQSAAASSASASGSQAGGGAEQGSARGENDGRDGGQAAEKKSGQGAGAAAGDSPTGAGSGASGGSERADGKKKGSRSDGGDGEEKTAGDEKTRGDDRGAGPSDQRDAKTAPPVADGEGEDGDEDDIVLRQIREAAERESDPILKEKLWKEYRKMKKAKG